MSFWSTLGKIAGIAGAPFTGGASLIPTLIGTGLDVAGAIGKGRASGREKEAQLIPQLDRSRLEGQLYNQKLPGNRLTDAQRGDYVSNVQPVTSAGEGRNFKLSGGVSPALYGPNSKGVASSMSRQALMSQLGQGGANDPYAQFQPTQAPQAGKVDSVLNGAGMAGGLLELLKRARVTQQPPPQIPDLGPIDPRMF